VAHALHRAATMRKHLFVLALLGACAAEREPVDIPAPASSGDDGARAILEADIIQVVDGRLYAMSKAGSVSVVDVSRPGKLVLLGHTELPGEPFEMYLVGDHLIAMTNREPSHVITLDVSDPAHITTLADHEVTGEVADSRLAGNVLYLATYENAPPRTLVTSIDIGDLHQIDQLAFQSTAPDGYNLPWGSHWKRSIFVTPTRLYIGGHADVAPNAYGDGTPEGIIDVIDISDPGGHMSAGPRIRVAGAILSRWQLDERDGVLRVISQRGAGRTGNGVASPEVATFAVGDFTPIGHTTLALPRQEGLRTVRFDATRAYAITYNQTDPLFVIDLADPAHPAQRGQLAMPGFMYHLEPRGDHVIGLGVDRTDPDGSLNVSLFDVSNPDRPTMINRVAFAQPFITEDYAILNGEVAEDQDRIQKAFRVFPDGVIVVPFSALRTYNTPDSCASNAGGGVQVVFWMDGALEKGSLLPLPGNPRRALENGDEYLTLSDSNVRTFRRFGGAMSADLVIDSCVPREATGSVGVGDPRYQYGECSAGGGSPLVLLGFVALRRRCTRKAAHARPQSRAN